jgi:arsenate reductase-like glutaredoxin family protein
MKTQLIGRKKSQETKRIERYLKERRLEHQFVDIDARPLGPRELDTVAEAVGGHGTLIDVESKVYRKRGMEYMEFDPRDELLEHPELLRVPIVRCDAGVAVCPDTATLDALLGS